MARLARGRLSVHRRAGSARPPFPETPAPPLPPRPPRGVDATARLKLRTPCAFLENGSCTIYAVRPFGCRGANSIDAELCRAFVEGRADAAKEGGTWLDTV